MCRLGNKGDPKSSFCGNRVGRRVSVTGAQNQRNWCQVSSPAEARGDLMLKEAVLQRNTRAEREMPWPTNQVGLDKQSF